ncbi:hypothetical protein R80B4_02671 [Fibrobacteres bacterium R8-0-B4]
MKQGTPRLKTGLAEMLKGGVIMDVTTPEKKTTKAGGAPSWRWSAFLRIFARTAAWPVWLTRLLSKQLWRCLLYTSRCV